MSKYIYAYVFVWVSLFLTNLYKYSDFCENQVDS